MKVMRSERFPFSFFLFLLKNIFQDIIKLGISLKIESGTKCSAGLLLVLRVSDGFLHKFRGKNINHDGFEISEYKSHLKKNIVKY